MLGEGSASRSSGAGRGHSSGSESGVSVDDNHPSSSAKPLHPEENCSNISLTTSMSSEALAEATNRQLSILDESRDQTIARLQAELTDAQSSLRARDEQCIRLSRMQQSVDTEIHELTAHLFQEAHRMVTEANVKRAHSEKLLKEARMRIDVMQSEVTALKVLVLNASPPAAAKSRRPVSADAADSRSSTRPTGSVGSSPLKSRFSITIGRRKDDEAVPPDGFVCSECGETAEQKRLRSAVEILEIDPAHHKEFTQWREKQDLENRSQPFLRRLYDEDILPCLHFVSRELTDEVLSAIETNAVVIEQIVSEERPRVTQCALTNAPKLCPFRVRLRADADWLLVSQLCRNRVRPRDGQTSQSSVTPQIAAVCDLFTYLRYLRDGLVKCGVHEAYREVVRLRRNVAYARLGISFTPGRRGS